MKEVCARLTQLSYRCRVLIVNNLVASALWLTVLPPTGGLIQELQRIIVEFFLSGHHWI